MKTKKSKKINKNNFVHCADCSDAIYLGEGDFACCKNGEFVLVMDEWAPAQDYRWCHKDDK